PVFYYDQNRFSILCQYKKGGWKVKFENTGLENLTAELKVLDEVLPKYGFTRAEHWDYEKVCYDRKFELTEGIYYLRVNGTVMEGDAGAHRAVIKLEQPVLGKYYFQYGLACGEDENFPKYLTDRCIQLLENLREELSTLSGIAIGD